jgi:hypothetical protein
MVVRVPTGTQLAHNYLLQLPGIVLCLLGEFASAPCAVLTCLEGAGQWW